jgi:hypothetical protein
MRPSVVVSWRARQSGWLARARVSRSWTAGSSPRSTVASMARAASISTDDDSSPSTALASARAVSTAPRSVAARWERSNSTTATMDMSSMGTSAASTRRPR